MSKPYFPDKSELMGAVVKALQEIGGEAKVSDINAKVIEILNLPDEVVELEDESGLGTKLDYRLRWVRTELKEKNIIKNVKRGIWILGDENESL